MNVVKRIERVALAVKDLGAARVFFEKLGARFQPEEVIEDMGIRYLPFDLGTSRMELLQATREDSPVARFLASRGQGVHHVTLEVEDLDQAIEELERADVPIHARHEYAPGVTFEGCVWREAFVHPRHSFGVLLHLAEKRPVKKQGI